MEKYQNAEKFADEAVERGHRASSRRRPTRILFHVGYCRTRSLEKAASPEKEDAGTWEMPASLA